ncbi:MAG: M13 family metallopeptidase [Wenzhouxiangellaceae bacterium]|nr:M13 family metallopeptidase [Wenzhouxiangellaceae bacterium]
MKNWILLVLTGLALAACGPADQDAETPVADAGVEPAEQQAGASAQPDPAARIGDWGVDASEVGDTIAPGDDFFAFVNAGWLERSEIPSGFSRFGAFTELSLEAEERVSEIIADAAAADAEPGDPRAQIGAMHAAYLDTDRIDALGLEPIREEFDRMLALESHEAVARWMARPGTTSIAGVYVSLDSGNPERYLVHLGQSGLGLPDKDYYARDDDPFPGHRAAYVDYIEATFERAGIDDARRRAEDVMALEMKIADAHWTRVQRRDREANYNLMRVAEIEAMAPGFSWDAFFAERELDGIEEVVVATDSAIEQLAALFAETPVATWSDYQAFHWINNHAPLLAEPYARAHFDLFSKRLNGVDEQRPRDKRATRFVSSRLREQVGKVYVERHFPPEYRDQMLDLVGYLGQAFDERLNALDWMDDETRAEALAKLEAFTPKVGFPDRWHDYSSVRLSADDLVGNTRRLQEWQWQDSLAKLDEPARDWEWFMSPQMVNAYYSSTQNEIVFPAGILQPPFFDPHADPAVNFGGIGAVIGHEMGHGFDDQGSKSDADGVLRNWWTDASRENFEALTVQLVEQYNAFEPIEGMNINGELTLGENIGDLGGLSIAYHAYHMYLDAHHGGEAPVLDGYTGDQRFFMSWAQVWRNLQTEESRRSRLINDSHSPPKYRVNGIVRNMGAWYDAFDVGEEAELWLPPEQRLSIW